MAVIICALSLIGEAAAREPFGLDPALVHPNLAENWERAKRTMDQELWILVRCRDTGICTPEARRILTIVEDAQKEAGLARIARPNRAINQALGPPAKDTPRFMRAVWMPSLESLARGAADCKAIVLLKLLTYRLIGFPENDLRAIYVRTPMSAEEHLVVAVRQDDAWRIADNRTHYVLTDTEIAQSTRALVRLNAFYSLRF